MPKNQNLSFSDLIRDPGSLKEVQDFNEMPDTDEDEYIKEYGVGIDCHSEFIEVCVRYRSGKSIRKAQKRFGTGWDSLLSAKAWCLDVLKTKASPVPDLGEPFHYLLESTANYHMPVCIAWGGVPTIINPVLAGATKRKTDVLDAKLLSLHDQLGVWRESYLPSDDVKTLRVMIAARDRCVRDATVAGNRINSILTRFGVTLGCEGSVVRNPHVRSTVEKLISEPPIRVDGVCPSPIPAEVRGVLRDEYHKFDLLIGKAEEWKEEILSKACSMEWETDDGILPGSEMVRILSTAPQVGEMTAVIWLARVVTPRRFPNAKALSAYCGLDPSLKISAGKVTSAKTRGGNKQLHKALTASASRLIYHHNEMFGIWGYNLQQQTGKKKKAANAVARKLSTALFYMMKTGREFSYDNYRMIRNIDVFDIPVDDLVLVNKDFKRYIRILHENNIHTTTDLATAYLSCKLGSCHGLGKKFFTLLRDFLDHHVTYKQMYDELKAELNKEEITDEAKKPGTAP